MEKKKTIIYSVIALTTLALLVVGATYAYFQNQYGASSNADIKVTTYTTDVLTFETGDAINISADQESFAQGKGNKSGLTFARATLQANNKTNTATANYYLYLNIENNTFTYTNTGTPELLLQVIDKTSGNPVTSITGLDYVTVTDGKNTSISGFDITNKKGLIALFSNKEISASPKTIEEYTVTITLVNHNFDQNNNTGKNLNGTLMIQKEKVPSNIADIAKSGDSLATAVETLGIKSDSSVTGLYHHDTSLINGAEDNSYRFAGSVSTPDYYSCKYKNNDVKNYRDNAVDGNINQSLKGNCSKIYHVVADGIDEYYDKSFENIFYNTYNVSWDSTNNKCLTSTNKEVIDWNGNKITDSTKCTGTAYQFTAIDDYYIGIEEVGEGVETFFKKAYEVNNYVCFGSDDTACPAGNLYRIIGLIDGKIKLISANPLTKDMLGTERDYYYSWNSTGTNTWSDSTLNLTILNTNYLTYLDGKNTKWKEMIDDTTWYVGGMSFENGAMTNAKTAYDYEVGVNKDASTTVTSKIGLMYLSEYYYGATPNYWTLPGIDENGIYDDSTDTWSGEDYSKAYNDNWMSIGSNEWTISRDAEDSSSAFIVVGNGNGVDSQLVSVYSNCIRPTFNLISSIKYVSGSGTSTDPIRISL